MRRTQVRGIVGCIKYQYLLLTTPAGPGPGLGATLIIHLLQKTDENGKEGKEFPLFMLAEAIYMSWFTFELLVRLVS